MPFIRMPINYNDLNDLPIRHARNPDEGPCGFPTMAHQEVATGRQLVVRPLWAAGQQGVDEVFTLEGYSSPGSRTTPG